MSNALNIPTRPSRGWGRNAPALGGGSGAKRGFAALASTAVIVLLATQTSSETSKAFSADPPLQFKCKFDLRCQPRAGCQEDDFEVQISDQPGDDFAEIASEVGTNNVLRHVGDEAVSYIEELPDGGTTSLTVPFNGQRAMLSRHVSLLGTFISSHYTGRCEAMN